MKTIMYAVVIAVSTVASTNVLDRPIQTAAAAEKATRMVQGVVMNTGDTSITVIPDHGDITEFAVATGTKVTRDGEVTKLDAVQPRDHVVVMCSGNTQDQVAVEIVAKSPF